MKSKPKTTKKAQRGAIRPTGLSLIEEFLWESNAIEQVYTKKALAAAKRAWKYAESLDQISYPDVLQIHKLLLQDIEPRIAGKFRKCDVFIGGQRKRFYSTELLIHMVTNCLVRLRKMPPESEKDRDEEAKFYHVVFEGIHPFEDGNGRVGRIIWQWHRLKMGLPIKVIHEGEEQMEYYKWFENN